MTADLDPPNHCQVFRDRLHNFLDGNRDALDAAGDAHRAACPACRSLYQAALLLRQGLERRASILVPGHLTDRLVASVLADQQVTPSRARGLARLLVTVAAAACALLVAILLSLHWRVNHRPPEPITP